MVRTDSKFRIDYYGKGFPGIQVNEARGLPKNHFDDPWVVCAAALARARRGDFSLMPAVLRLYGATGDAALDDACSTLLSVAGTTSCFSTIATIVTGEPNVSKVFGLCGALAVRGEMSYIPILLDKYLANEGNADAAALIDFINDLIGHQLMLPTDDYEEFVLRSYERMLAQFGDDKVLVSRGERYGVVRLAQHILRDLQTPYFRVRWKAEFEAATGLDCSGWYRGDELQPLAAAAVVEEFLEGSEINGYVDGERYFFGHRVPD